MTMQENSRLIEALRARGWTGDEICDLFLWVDTGDPRYGPEPRPKKEQDE